MVAQPVGVNHLFTVRTAVNPLQESLSDAGAHKDSFAADSTSLW
jgi:hypothetical protein